MQKEGEGGHSSASGKIKSIVRVESVNSALRPEFRVSRHTTNERGTEWRGEGVDKRKLA